MNNFFNYKKNNLKYIHDNPKNSVQLNKNIITFSTCWYMLKSKFNDKTYIEWIKNFVSIINKFNLVIYTDNNSFKQISKLINLPHDKIKIIIKPFEDFYMYKYKDFWINNHKKSNLNLHIKTDWHLNMLWNEKVFFVNETIQNRYFDSLYYGWCDIGYFRNRPNDLHTNYLSKWPNYIKLLNYPFTNKIHYGCVQNDTTIYNKLSHDIKTHYTEKQSRQPSCLFEEKCFAGGFFILKPSLIDIYTKLYDAKLLYYFINTFIIKDDQTIIMDIIFTNPNIFYIHTEDNTIFDNWFMFQRLLC